MEDEIGGEQPQEVAEGGPLTSRLESKSWKTRMDAYAELSKVFEGEEENAFEEFTSFLHKAVADSNVNAQDKAIEATIAFARKASTQLVSRCVSQIVNKAIEKGFGQPKCKPKAQELALQLIEADAGEVVAEELVKGCSHKQPKVASACVETLRMAVESFGLRAMGPQSKAIVKMTVTLFDSTVAAVRSEAKPLAIELFKYMGAALKPSFENLRPAQQKELEEAFANISPAVPTRLTRSAQAAKEAESTSAKPSKGPVAASSACAAGNDVDPLEFLEAVEVLGKLPNGWCEKVLAAPKWQEKKEFLDTLNDLAKSPKLASGDYTEVVKTLKRLMGDSMVLVVSTAVTAFSLLATGLRKEFKQCAQLCVATLLDKFKEKDRRVIEAVHSAFDAVYGRCMTLVDLSEDLMTALGPKGGAKAKVEVLKFIKRAVDAKSGPVIPKNLRTLIDLVVKTTDDSTPEIRDGACSVLSSLVSSCGAMQMKPFLDSLDEKKKKKIESMADPSASSASIEPEPAAAAPAAAAATKSIGLKRPAAVAAQPSKEPSEPPAKKPVAKVASSAPAPKASASTTSKPASSANKAGKDDADAEASSGATLEELDALASEVMPSAVMEKLSSSNWKERLEGVEELEADLKERLASLQPPAPEAIVRVLMKSFVDKKETNFQVMGKVIAVVAFIAEKAIKFTKRAAYWMIPCLIEKLGDMKLRGPSQDCLMAMSEVVTPQFILTQAYEAITKQKSPKTQENALLWVNALAVEFGLKAIKAKPLLDHIKSMLEATNPGVKKAAVEVLVTMRRQLGPDVRGMLSDVKPALLVTIDEAFAKVADEAPMANVPRRQVKGEEGSETPEEVQIVNLTGPVASHLKALGDANWKERQAALTAIEELVVKAKPLGCTGPYMDVSCGELWAGLKARLKDSNKNLATQTLGLLAKIADAVGPSIERCTKAILPGVLTLIADNKKQVRDSVLACLSSWAAQLPSDIVIKNLPVALTVDAPAGREDAVKWAADYLARMDRSSAVDISPILPPVVECLEHRVAEVRSGAERCLAVLIACGGLDAVNRCLRDVKPAQLKTLRPIVDKAEKVAASMSLSSSGPATASSSAPAQVKIDTSIPLPLKADQTAVADSVKSTPRELCVEVNVAASLSRSLPLSGGAKRALAGSPLPKQDIQDRSEEHEVSAGADGSKVLRCNGGKEAREKQHGKLKWVVEDAREAESLLEALERQMAAVSSDEVHGKLFHKDFKKQVDGMRDLVAFIGSHPKELTDNLDMILKMCSLRMTGKAANTTLVLAVLDLLRAAFEVLVAHDYRLSDSEASVCLPVLMEEVGGNNDSVRKLIRDLLRKAPQVYPTSKIFSQLLDAAHITRNQRSRAECLAEMTALVEKMGLDQVCLPSKALPAIANYIAERDSLVRNNAIDCIVAAYQSAGDKVSKYLTKLEPKDRDILDTKLKKAKAALSGSLSMDPTRMSSPRVNGKSQDVRSSMPEFAAASVGAANRPPADPLRASAPSLSDTPTKTSRSAVHDLLDAPTPSISNIRSRFNVPAGSTGAGESQRHDAEDEGGDMPDLMQCQEDLQSADAEVRVQAMKDLSLHFEEESRRPRGPSRRALAKEAEEIVILLQRVITDWMACGFDRDSTRGVKYALHATHLLFSALPDVACTIRQETVGRLLEDLLLLASNEAAKGSDEEMQVVGRGTEELVMDVLGSADCNAVFTTLIQFLYEGARLSGGQEPPVDFIANVLRCLMEMARRMSTYLARLRVDTLLYDAHLFLVAHPPSKYRGREFRPLRLLKTILNELVKLKGESIREHLTLVPVDSKPTLCSYLDLVLQQHAAGRAAPVASATVSSSSAVPDNSITGIFDRITSKDKEVAKEGFRLLHAYQRSHPDFSLDQYLENRSPQFQEHVHKSLAKVQAQLDGGDLPSPMHASTGGAGSSSTFPLQNAMSSANRAASLGIGGLASSSGPGGSGSAPSACPAVSATTASGALADKLQGFRSALAAPTSSFHPPAAAGVANAFGYTPLSARGAPEVTAASLAETASSAPSTSAAVAAAPAPSMSSSVLSLQERLARLKSS